MAGATNGNVRQVVQLARELNLTVDSPGARLDLPVSSSLVMATNALISLGDNQWKANLDPRRAPTGRSSR